MSYGIILYEQNVFGKVLLPWYQLLLYNAGFWMLVSMSNKDLGKNRNRETYKTHRIGY